LITLHIQEEEHIPWGLKQFFKESKMKAIKYYHYILALLLMSCNKLELQPEDFVSPDEYYNNKKELEMALNAVYATFQTNGSYGSYLARLGFDADEGYNGVELNSVSNYAVSAADVKILSFWRDYYGGIKLANTLLKYIDKPTDISDKERDRIRGEALFLRAYFYFMLVTNFSDVPLILEPINSAKIEELQIPRTPAKLVYEQIIKDMTTAADLVLDITETKGGGRVNKSAVYGILARVCLHMAGNPLKDYSKYQEAANWCKKVIDLNIHKLNPDYKQVFINYMQDKYDIEESLWEVEFYGNGLGIYASSAGYVGSNNGIRNYDDFELGYTFTYLNTTAYTYNVYNTNNDLRRTWNVASFYYEGNPAVEKNWTTTRVFDRYPGKFRRAYEILLPKHRSRTPTNYPLLRYSDVLLMYAEALNETNQMPTPAAYDAINRVRRRGYGKDQTIADGTIDLTGYNYSSFFSEIKKERTRELAFENLRKGDLVRWGDFLTRMKSCLNDAYAAPIQTWMVERAITYYNNATERDVLWPIPSSELDVNQKLTQNSGW